MIKEFQNYIGTYSIWNEDMPLIPFIIISDGASLEQAEICGIK